jgi:hypothetical protein
MGWEADSLLLAAKYRIAVLGLDLLNARRLDAHYINAVGQSV